MRSGCQRVFVIMWVNYPRDRLITAKFTAVKMNLLCLSSSVHIFFPLKLHNKKYKENWAKMPLCCFGFQSVSTWEGWREQKLHCSAFLPLLHTREDGCTFLQRTNSKPYHPSFILLQINTRSSHHTTYVYSSGLYNNFDEVILYWDSCISIACKQQMFPLSIFKRP